jgi:hypothetical protein
MASSVVLLPVPGGPCTSEIAGGPTASPRDEATTCPAAASCDRSSLFFSAVYNVVATPRSSVLRAVASAAAMDGVDEDDGAGAVCDVMSCVSDVNSGERGALTSAFTSLSCGTRPVTLLTVHTCGFVTHLQINSSPRATIRSPRRAMPASSAYGRATGRIPAMLSVLMRAAADLTPGRTTRLLQPGLGLWANLSRSLGLGKGCTP